MLNTFNLPLLASVNTALVIWLAAVDAFFVLFIVVVIVFNKVRKPKARVNNDEWLIALGGKENIKEVNATGSRLALTLNDKDNIDREKLKTLGVSSVLVMSNKVTLVIEGKAEQIAESLKQSL